MANNDKPTTLIFEREPFEIDFDEEAKWFFESSPYGSNRENVLRYIDILVAAKPPEIPYTPVIVRNSDEIGKTL